MRTAYGATGSGDEPRPTRLLTPARRLRKVAPVQTEVEHHTALEATPRAIQALMERQEAEREEAAEEQTAEKSRELARVAREHEEELEARLNRLHPADAAFVLESLPAEAADTACALIHL